MHNYKPFKIKEGVTYKLLQTGEDTNHVFSLIEATYEIGTGFGEHIHSRENETFYVIHGEVEFKVNNESFHKSSGDSIYLAKNKRHSFIVKSDKAKLILLIEPAGLEKYFVQVGEQFLKSPSSTSKIEDLSEILKNFGITII